MAQEGTASNGNNSAPPATNNFGSMSPGESKTGILVGAATDKGKGLVKTEQEERGSKGKSSADVVAADGAMAGGSDAADGRTGGHGRRGDRQVHVVTERERRRRMRDMFTNLQTLLPNLPDKTDKATMVGVAIDHIKSLEVTLANLEKRKQEMKLARGRRGPADAGASSSVAPPPVPAAPTQVVLPVGAHGGMPPAAAAVTAAPAGLQTWSGPNVVLTVSGDDAYVNVCAARRQGVMTMVAAVLEKHRIDVVTSEVASDDSRSMLMIHARVNNNGASSQFGDNVTSEEIYKLAVSEMMVWLSS